MLKNNLSFSLTETIVRRFFKEFKGSPKRSLRNIVDIALHFSEGRFQKGFFSAIQNMLKNSDSAYYKMIEDMVYDLEMDRLVTFGMNVGYNSCTEGAKIIRNIEAKEQFNIPWSVSLQVNGQNLSDHFEEYETFIKQGNELGVHTWMVYSNNAAVQVVDLAKHFPDDAFIIFADCDEVDSNLSSRTKHAKNMMIALKYGSGIEDACCRLREAGMLYSIYKVYRKDEAEVIKDGSFLKKAEAMKPVFTGFMIGEEDSEAVAEDMFYDIKGARDGQRYSTVPWDIIKDSMTIDSIISDDSCFVFFEENGDLITYDNGYRKMTGNLFEQSLKDILESNFPKQTKDARI